MVTSSRGLDFLDDLSFSGSLDVLYSLHLVSKMADISGYDRLSCVMEGREDLVVVVRCCKPAGLRLVAPLCASQWLDGNTFGALDSATDVCTAVLPSCIAEVHSAPLFCCPLVAMEIGWPRSCFFAQFTAPL